MITVGMFGPLSVRVGARVFGPRDLGGKKPRRLLELLLVHQRGVSKDELIEHLWGDRPPRDPVATLEAYVSVLRSTLQPGVHRDQSLIATQPGAYRLVRERADIDTDRFEALLRALLGASVDERRSMLLEACSLATAPILEDEPYAEWALAARRNLERLRLDAHVAAGEACLDAGMASTALDLAELAVRIDASCEAGYQVAMRAAAQLGRRDMVVRFYEQCTSALRAELGVAPMPSTIGLRDQLLDERRLVGVGAGSSNWSPAGDDGSYDSLWPLSRFK